MELLAGGGALHGGKRQQRDCYKGFCVDYIDLRTSYRQRVALYMCTTSFACTPTSKQDGRGVTHNHVCIIPELSADTSEAASVKSPRNSFVRDNMRKNRLRARSRAAGKLRARSDRPE